MSVYDPLCKHCGQLEAQHTPTAAPPKAYRRWCVVRYADRIPVPSTCLHYTPRGRADHVG